MAGEGAISPFVMSWKKLQRRPSAIRPLFESSTQSAFMLFP